MSKEEDILLEDEFEYHEGLGDLLNKNERHQFSWPKTIIVVVSFLMVIGLGTMLIFSIGKHVLVKSPEKPFGAELKVETVKQVIPEDMITALPKNKEITTLVKKKMTRKEASQKILSKIADDTQNTLSRVIVGSFVTYSPAKNLVAALKQKKISAYIWTYEGNGKTVYRVQVGAFKNVDKAKSLSSKMKKSGLDAYIVQK